MFMIFILSVVVSFAGSTELDGYLVSVDNVEFHGNERFPEAVDVVFGNQGNDISLKFVRDDEATELLSEEVFEVSKILPTGVFTDAKRHNFAAYNSGNSNVMVLQRESTDDKPKFYGRFAQNDVKMVIQPENGSPVHHRVRREDREEHRRTRRAVDNEYIIETFVIADLSVFEHVRDEYMPSGSSNADIKEFIRSYLNGITKEVDTIYQHLGESELNNTLRVYFQQYQIITKSSQQKWVTDNLSNDVLQQAAVSALQTYYGTLITKFAFPITDKIIHLTRLDLQNNVQEMSTGLICQASTSISTTIARMRYSTVAISQGIAKSLNVADDGDGNDCDPADQFIMSPANNLTDSSANQGNKWTFSNCSVSSFVSTFTSGWPGVSCLQTEDIIFNLTDFDRSPFITDLLTLDQQCEIIFLNGSTFCNPDEVDCYSQSQGCRVEMACVPVDVPQFTPCNFAKGECLYGFCVEQTTSSTTVTTEGGLQTTTVTEDPDRSTTDVTGTVNPTTTPDDCVIQTGFVEFDLPGCGCCGGCGCDKGCGAECEPGLPSKTQSDSCTKEANCCGSKVKMTTLFVPDGCELTYVPGPRTLVMEKKGWEETDADVTAEVYQDNYDRWQVNLVPKN